MRVQFDLTPGAVERLDKLVTTAEAASRAEVFRWALFLVGEAITAQAAGGVVVTRDASGREREVLLPFHAADRPIVKKL